MRMMVSMISWVKIDFNKLNPVIKAEIKEGEGDAYEIFRDNLSKFISIPSIQPKGN